MKGKKGISMFSDFFLIYYRLSWPDLFAPSASDGSFTTFFFPLAVYPHGIDRLSLWVHNYPFSLMAILRSYLLVVPKFSPLNNGFTTSFPLPIICQRRTWSFPCELTTTCLPSLCYSYTYSAQFRGQQPLSTSNIACPHHMGNRFPPLVLPRARGPGIFYLRLRGCPVLVFSSFFPLSPGAA